MICIKELRIRPKLSVNMQAFGHPFWITSSFYYEGCAGEQDPSLIQPLSSAVCLPSEVMFSLEVHRDLLWHWLWPLRRPGPQQQNLLKRQSESPNVSMKTEEKSSGEEPFGRTPPCRQWQRGLGKGDTAHGKAGDHGKGGLWSASPGLGNWQSLRPNPHLCTVCHPLDSAQGGWAKQAQEWLQGQSIAHPRGHCSHRRQHTRHPLLSPVTAPKCDEDGMTAVGSPPNITSPFKIPSSAPLVPTVQILSITSFMTWLYGPPSSLHLFLLPHHFSCFL